MFLFLFLFIFCLFFLRRPKSLLTLSGIAVFLVDDDVIASTFCLPKTECIPLFCGPETACVSYSLNVIDKFPL